MNQLYAQIKKMNKRLDDLENKFEEKGNNLEKNIIKENNSNNKREKTLAKVNSGKCSVFIALRDLWIPIITERFNTIESKLDSFESRFDSIESNFDSIKPKM